MSNVSPLDRSPPISEPEFQSKFLLSKNEGQAAGEAVVRCVNAARSSIIDAAVLIRNDLDRFQQNRDAVNGYVGALTAGGVLAEGDARLGENASKLSVYRKVGEHANLLSGLCHYFDPSLYVYYDVVRFFEALGRDERALENRLQAMARLGVSRESLQQAIRDLRSTKQLLPASPLVQEDIPSSPGTQIITPTGEFGLVFATPSKSDIRLLARDLVDSAVSTPRCLKVHERTAQTAVLLAASRVIDLPIVVQRLLPYCGFSDASHVFLMEDAQGHDITECRALTVSTRGDYPIAASKLSEDIAKGLSPFALAADLATEDDGRLHLFADEASLGWTSIVGADNWFVRGAS